MSSPLCTCPETFTLDRLRAVWREGKRAQILHKESYQFSMSSNLEYDANHNVKYRRKFCLSLHAAVRDPVGHRERIDEAFAPFLVALIPDSGRVDEDVVRI